VQSHAGKMHELQKHLFYPQKYQSLQVPLGLFYVALCLMELLTQVQSRCKVRAKRN